MSRILITGAGGFVGANLLRALIKRNDDVHVIVRNGKEYWRLADLSGLYQVHYADITDEEDIQKIIANVQPEIVYHLAHFGGNRGETDSATIRRVIIDGTANLYSACITHGVSKIIHTGSSSEYGLKNEPMTEQMMLEPNTEYGLAKAWVTQYGEHIRKERGINITTLRLFSVYGPYESATRFFPATVRSLMREEMPLLSNKYTARDFVYIDDVIGALLLAQTGPAGVYNVGTGIESTLGDAVEIIQRELQSTLHVIWGGIEGRSFDSSHWLANTSFSEAQLHFSAHTKLDDGIVKLIEWFKVNGHWYV